MTCTTGRRGFLAASAVALFPRRVAADARADLANDGSLHTTHRQHKALDVLYSVRMPKGWVSYDPKLTYVVREFAYHRPDQMMIGGHLYVFPDIKAQNYGIFLPRKMRRLEVEKTTVQELPASLRDYQFDLEPNIYIGEPKYVRCLTLVVQYRSRHVAHVLWVAGDPDDAETGERDFAALRPMFRAVFGSAKLESQEPAPAS